MLWHPKTLQNLAMYNVFFHFWPFFHCRKATKMTQNSISIPSCAQTPKNPRKMSKTPPYSGLGAKPFFGVWSRCETVFGPPPAKADIATAILTNVIEHLVLLLPPNKHAFTAKAVWADFNKGAAYSFLPSFAPRVLLLLRPSSCAILVFCGHQGTRMSQQVPAQAEHFPESYRELQVNLGTHRPEPHRELRIQLGTRGLEDLNLLASFRPNWACTDPNTY